MKIVLDPGHYVGYNVSPVYPSYNEGAMTWELTNYVADALKAKGHSVIFTKTDPKKDPPVFDRGQLAANADLLLSLHSNACDSPSIRRVVMCVPHEDKSDTYELANRLALAASETMGIKEKHQLYVRTFVSDGVTWDYYGIIRSAVSAKCKRSLIMECSFHTNKMSTVWLSDSMNLKFLANVIASTVDNYFRELYGAPSIPVAKEYKVGDKYLLTSNDIYTNGKKPASYTLNKEYTILKVTDTAYLLSDIVSWIVKPRVANTAPEKKEHSVGDKYLLTSNDIYTNGKKPASYAIGKEYAILKITSEAYLLDGIMSWVKRV